ncbi:hypothetical protein C8Q80DRAFT_1303691 [Daedaleopsis nitida]|nr:hypothetical protein C8Q80DRAFT_1303691 [Daedaleopsis nitida]
MSLLRMPTAMSRCTASPWPSTPSRSLHRYQLRRRRTHVADTGVFSTCTSDNILGLEQGWYRCKSNVRTDLNPFGHVRARPGPRPLLRRPRAYTRIHLLPLRARRPTPPRNRDAPVRWHGRRAPYDEAWVPAPLLRALAAELQDFPSQGNGAGDGGDHAHRAWADDRPRAAARRLPAGAPVAQRRGGGRNHRGHVPRDAGGEPGGVRGLWNAKGPEWPSHLKGVLDTNTFILPGEMPAYRSSYGGLARDISRVNHSCTPNAHVAWDRDTLTFVLRAYVPIRAGQQVTVSYVGVPEGHRARQAELLRRYAFACACAVCSGDERARDASDFRRAVVSTRATDADVAEDEARFRAWVADGAPVCQMAGGAHGRARAGAAVELYKELDGLDGFRRAQLTLQCMEEEGWFHGKLWEPVLARLVKGYSVLEDEESVRKYAITAALLRKTYTGSDGGWAAVARSPKQTEWWGKLGTKRA